MPQTVLTSGDIKLSFIGDKDTRACSALQQIRTDWHNALIG